MPIATSSWRMLLLLLSICGCAAWQSDTDQKIAKKTLPVPRQHTGSAVIETAFISIIPSADIDIWDWIDETVIAPEVRRELHLNGLRVGRAQRLADFGDRLNQIRRVPSESGKVLDAADIESDLTHHARRISCRVGRRYEFPVRQPSTSEQIVLASIGGETVGRTLTQAHPLFALKALAADMNSLTLSLRPEVQYGPMRQTWVGSDAALRIENRRDVWTFERLTTDITLERKGVLVAGCMNPPTGLGHLMFTGTTSDGDADQVLLLIRVVELPDLLVP